MPGTAFLTEQLADRNLFIAPGALSIIS